MEFPMQTAHLEHAPVPENQLRFVFSETVVSASLPDNSTLEDIARTLRELSGQRYGSPLAIEVTMHEFSQGRSQRPAR